MSDKKDIFVENDFDADIIPPMVPLKNNKELLNTPVAKPYLENTSATLLDIINLAYVAFTRAINRLIVTYYDKKTTAKTKSANDSGIEFGSYIAKTLEQFDEFETQKTENSHAEEKIFGARAQKTPDSEHTKSPIDTGDMNSEEKKNYDIKAYYSHPDNSTWNLLVSDDDLPDPTKATDRGVILHDVMRAIRKPDDLPLALRKRVASIGLPAKTVNEYQQQLTTAISDKKVSKWFNGYKRVITERAIAIEEQKIKHRDGEEYSVLSRRPDRVVVMPDNSVEIIDYKFGEHTPKTDSKYLRQIKEYISLYRQLGYKDVKGFIWYVTENSDNNIVEYHK